MKRVFVDTNIIIDYLAEREPYNLPTLDLFNDMKDSRYMGMACSLSFVNTHYFLRRELGSTDAVRLLKKLESFITVLPVDEKVISQALSSDFGDFEDAVQYHSALRGKADVILTRDVRGYKKSKIKVCSAAEFIKEIYSN